MTQLEPLSEDRSAARHVFLDRAGWRNAEIALLAADASFRSYHRVIGGGRQAVLMDAPPPLESVEVFHRVQQILLDLGFSVPKPLAMDVAEGFLLLEDLGDRTFTRALAEGDDEEALYRLAVDVLIELHRKWRPGPDNPPDYSDQLLDDEALLLTDWYYEAVAGRPIDPAVRADYLAAWKSLWPRVRRVPRSLVLRDYHVDNLMTLAGRPGTAGCGLLDFQDAVCGEVTYDLVSLLQDARRDLSPGLEAAMIARYLAAFPELDQAAFAESYAILGAQRSAKIIGIFTRLNRRDGKQGYLRHIPRVWRLLAADLQHPALKEVRDWFDRELPAPLRVRPTA